MLKHIYWAENTAWTKTSPWQTDKQKNNIQEKKDQNQQFHFALTLFIPELKERIKRS